MISTQDIEYHQNKAIYRGFMAFDDTLPQPKPCVMIAHDWSGRNSFFCEKAKQLAAMGYVGFAVDLYGNAQTGETTDEKKALLESVISRRENVAERFLAAFDKALTLRVVDPQKIAAIGYCFGGLAVLDLARTGADVKGVISFHGLLSAPETRAACRIRSKILALHGYDDPLVPPAQVEQFAAEMTAKKADWQVHMYGHTQHAFTNPMANDDKMGLHYNREADLRSWRSTESFLAEIF
ncbi:MAG: dienelactone hydrolase family protein [Legionellales bacterium]|nr:dienelactone hydrolase family protein [Legionellales bacterium]